MKKSIQKLKDLQKIRYEDLLSQTKNFSISLLGYWLFETLSMNFPTIVFNSKKVDIIRDEAKPYYEKLKRVNIFFDHEMELANHINKIWSNYFEWWNSDNVQEAVNEFCNNFAYINKIKLKI